MIESIDPSPEGRRLFVRDLVLEARIGVRPREQRSAQRVRINIVLDLDAPAEPGRDELDAVVSYEPLVEASRAVVAEGHIKLVETVAERLLARCFFDPRIRRARVRVEKLDVYPDAEVGVEIERGRR